MRSACGSNDHPDSSTFICLFRLMNTYSLVKPPRGSNITGGDILHSLLDITNLPEAHERQVEFNKRLDFLLDASGDCNFSEDDHNYIIQNTNDEVINYLAGFYAHRAKKFTKCLVCQDHLISHQPREKSSFINIKEKYSLCNPSREIVQIVKLIEVATMNNLSKGTLQIDTLGDILHHLENSKSVPLIGCPIHRETFTRAILKYCMIARMHFLCKQSNAMEEIKKKAQKHRKLAKL